MEYRLLGSSGLKVSPLCLGALNFGGLATPDEEAIATVHAALDEGVNFIDTANSYSNGGSESVVGKALKGRRDGVVVATKVHSAMGQGPNDAGSSRRHIKMQCEASLRRLQTDWIDLYQLHRPDWSTPIEETFSALDDLVREGKVMYVGVSTFPAWRTMEAIAFTERSGMASRPVSEQPPYHLLDRQVEAEIVPLARHHGLGLLPWSPLAAGILTGKYSAGQIPSGSRLAMRGMQSDDPGLVSAMTRVRRLETLAAEAGMTLVQMALGWLINQPGVTAPVIGPRDRTQLSASLSAVDARIGDDLRAAIDQITPPGQVALHL
jgi:aryl-alcohol dehydrogenase-like predicted oxidoreductase